MEDEFEDTNGIIRIRISNIQHNGQKRKSTKGQTTIYKTYKCTHKTKDVAILLINNKISTIVRKCAFFFKTTTFHDVVHINNFRIFANGVNRKWAFVVCSKTYLKCTK